MPGNPTPNPGPPTQSVSIVDQPIAVKAASSLPVQSQGRWEFFSRIYYGPFPAGPQPTTNPPEATCDDFFNWLNIQGNAGRDLVSVTPNIGGGVLCVFKRPA